MQYLAVPLSLVPVTWRAPGVARRITRFQGVRPSPKSTVLGADLAARLLAEGRDVSTIARIMGVSRASVYRLVRG